MNRSRALLPRFSLLARRWGTRYVSSLPPASSIKVNPQASQMAGEKETVASPISKPKKKLKGFKQERTTILNLRKKYKKGEKLVFMSAYDYPTASLADKAGVDCILVGDSVGMVVMGQKSTIPVTMDEIVYHCKGVVRGASRAYLLGDMPFGSFLDPRDAVENASRIIKEGGVDGVKLEGGRDVAPQVSAISKSGILVVGHIGLTPQTASALGGFKTQGRNAKAALQLLEDALILEQAGCSMILIECVPPLVAKYITEKLSIPTIGIGAGPHCSAQIQIFHDLVGMFDMFKPRFSKQYTDIGSQIENAIHEYVLDVKNQEFPNKSQCYSIKEEQYNQFLELADAKYSHNEEPSEQNFHQTEPNSSYPFDNSSEHVNGHSRSQQNNSHHSNSLHLSPEQQLFLQSDEFLRAANKFNAAKQFNGADVYSLPMLGAQKLDQEEEGSEWIIG